MTTTSEIPLAGPGFKFTPPTAVAYLGTVAVCVAAIFVMSGLPVSGQTLFYLWIVGLLMQIAGFVLALILRH